MFDQHACKMLKLHFASALDFLRVFGQNAFRVGVGFFRVFGQNAFRVGGGFAFPPRSGEAIVCVYVCEKCFRHAEVIREQPEQKSDMGNIEQAC